MTKKLLITILLYSCFIILKADDTTQEPQTKNKTILEMFKPKREEVFEFTTKPKLTQQGNQTEIVFETKGFCDATVVIENADGKIVRHLASGLLGPNAPLPFQKNSKKQTLIWDGKDDKEVYADKNCVLRVSLGLKPQFEKNVLWSPYRRIGIKPPIIASCDEGMLVSMAQVLNICDFLTMRETTNGLFIRFLPINLKKSKV